MGHHYLPQEYLRGFADPSDSRMVWMYDKQTRNFVRASIKSVAQQPEYYTADDERSLNELVERPANAVLRRLRSGDQAISLADRDVLAAYVATMLMRVPHRRKAAMMLYPRVLKETFERVAILLTQAGQSSEAEPELISRRLGELERLRAKFAAQPPKEIKDLVRAPWPREVVLRCVTNMSWRFVHATEASGFFLTSDNPAFFFEGYGLGSPESELTFPLGSNLVLLASQQGLPGGTEILSGPPGRVRQLVLEVNRRVASSAERFVFYHSDEEWVPRVASKQSPQLNRIWW